MTVQEFLQLNEEYIGPTGNKWDHCNAINQLNRARSALYGIDNWSGLLSEICVRCAAEIYVPWFADFVVGAYRCSGAVHIDDGSYWAAAERNCCGAEERVTRATSRSPVPISNSFTSRIGIKSGDFEDEGKKVTITYVTKGGSVITNTLELRNSGFSVTEDSVVKIVSISKQSTHGYIYFFSVNSDGKLNKALFSAHPMETHLSYAKYCVDSSCCSSCSKLILTVKKKYVPLTTDHYNLYIELPEHALSLAMQAIAERGKRTPEGYAGYKELISSAINYLRKNEIKRTTTIGDLGHSSDYPSILG